MSLRHGIPVFEPAGTLGSGEIRPMRRMAAPVPVGYRAGGSIGDIIEAIRCNAAVLIDGAVGVGKSTVLPALISQELNMRVVHVVPSEFLAFELAGYLNRDGTEHVKLILDPNEVWPDNRVLLMPAAVVQSYMMQRGKLQLPECILYHDESHKSDAWTYLLARQWGSIDGVKKYVNATATSAPGGFRRREAAGIVTSSLIPKEDIDAPWEVMAHKGMPWEVSRINGNVLIFEDDPEKASKLVADYARCGLDPFRLSSRMSLRAFQAAMLNLAGPGLTVLIADSTFRDGFTWNVSTIIDTGSVIFTSMQNGYPARYRRDAYQFEMYQAAGRGARVAGQTCHVWQADRRYAATRMVLEEMECEAVALVSRMFSVLPPIEVCECKMAEGEIPRNLVTALNSGQPLACLTPAQTAPLAATGYRRAPSPVTVDIPELRRPGMDFVHPTMSATLANSREFADYTARYEAKLAAAEKHIDEQRGIDRTEGTGAPKSVEVVDTSESMGAPQPVKAVNLSKLADDVRTVPSEASVSSVPTVASTVASLEKMMLEDVGDESAEPGKYYYSSDVDMGRTSSLYYPDGWKSVLSVYSQPWMYHSMSALPDSERQVLIAALLGRFNQLSCELNASHIAVGDVKLLASSRAKLAVKDWLTRYLESITELSTQLTHISCLIDHAISGYTCLDQVGGDVMRDKEREMANAMVASFRDLRVARDDGGTVVAGAIDVGTYQSVRSAAVVNPLQLQTSGGFKPVRSRGGVSRATRVQGFVAYAAGGKPGMVISKRPK